MGICAIKLPTPRELINEWREGMEGSLNDMFVFIFSLGDSEDDSVQLIREQCWWLVIIYVHKKYKLRLLSGEVESWS